MNLRLPRPTTPLLGWLLALCALWSCVVLAGWSKADPRAFSHARHAALQPGSSLDCASCHPEHGANAKNPPPTAREACHRCHHDEGQGEPRGSRDCARCHGERTSTPSPAAPTVSTGFDHALHAPALAREGVACSRCHPLGAGAEPTPAIQRNGRSEANCHACHLAAAGAAGRSSTSCTSCHATRPRPRTHDASWSRAHGGDARIAPETCRACHRDASCVDCHARKESGRFRAHPPGWERIHAIEARVDPASCGLCHAEASCRACHARGRGR